MPGLRCGASSSVAATVYSSRFPEATRRRECCSKRERENDTAIATRIPIGPIGACARGSDVRLPGCDPARAQRAALSSTFPTLAKSPA
jgi:hypothetical protein